MTATANTRHQSTATRRIEWVILAACLSACKFSAHASGPLQPDAGASTDVWLDASIPSAPTADASAVASDQPVAYVDSGDVPEYDAAADSAAADPPQPTDAALNDAAVAADPPVQEPARAPDPPPPAPVTPDPPPRVPPTPPANIPGAPGVPLPVAGFLSIDQRLAAVLTDLRSFSRTSDRKRMRYIDLSTLSNAGLSAEETQIYREVISLLINSLSHGRSVLAPAPIDAQALIYRIDLRDYGWTEATWAQLETSYPYAVVYDPNSRILPFDEVSAERIRTETNCRIPIIQADWFLSHASRPPLYHTLLGLPDTLAELETQLGVDISNDIANGQVLRAGFAAAGPSRNNRVIERHDRGGNRGALWVSYDFINNVDERNVFENPLDFRPDGVELMFNLDNGLQSYLIVSPDSRRIDKAPNTVVKDPASRDGAVENGLSCMSCHQQDGALPRYDDVRAYQSTAGVSAKQLEAVYALYATRDAMQAAFDADQKLYRSARDALGVSRVTNTTLHTLDDRHLGAIDLAGIAGVLGLPLPDLLRAVDASPAAFPVQIVKLRGAQAGLPRDEFEAIFGDVVKGLGLGERLTGAGQ